MGLTKFAAFEIEAVELAPGAPLGVQDVADRGVNEFVRTASFQGTVALIDRPVSEFESTARRTRHAGWTKQAHRHEFEYEPRPGFLYVRSRAISSRINDNFDGFPAEEIKKAYGSFVGKPVFVNHNNSNHRRARGVIIAAALHEDVAPDGSPDTWVEVLMEVDAIKFPKLAQAVIAGHIDRTSMGTDVAYSICTFCGNKAASPLEYCSHIPKLKGQRIQRMTASGEKESVLVAEMCYGLGFFENSLLVEPPADPTAFTFGLDTRGLGVTASKTAMPSGDSITTVIAWARQNAERAGTASVSRLSGTDVLALCDFIGDDSNETVRWARQNAERAEGASVSRVSGTDILKLCDMAEAKLGKTAAAVVDETPLIVPPEWVDIDWKREKAEADRMGDYMELDEDFFAEGARKVGAVEQMRVRALGHEEYLTLNVRSEDKARIERLLPLLQYGPDYNRGVLSNVRDYSLFAGRGEDQGAERYLYIAEVQAGFEEWDQERAAGRPSKLPGMESKQRRVASTQITEWPSEWDVLMHHHGLGEMKAPPKVDTMRDSKCPVCGEEEGFNGDECVVCQFIKPPDMFMDPDTDMAGKVDLRQEQQDGLQNAEDATGTGDLVCDNCGTEFDDPDAQDADNEGKELPEEEGDDTPPVQKDAPPGSPYKPEESPGNMKSDRPSPDNANDVDDDGDTEDDLGKDLEDDEHPEVDEDVEDEVDDPETVQPKAGDTCPDCGKGTLTKKSPEPEASAEDEEASKSQDDEDDEKKSEPPWAKKSSHRGATVNAMKEYPVMAPRPFHIVAAEQQANLDYLTQGMERIASLAGVDLTDLQGQRQQRVAAVRRVALEDPQVNPTQPPGPIMQPTPPAEAPAATTEEAKTPTATDHPTNVGASPLTNVAPDAQVGLADSGPVLDAPLDLNEQDVTKPVAGTEQVRPASETRTETEIRTGTPADSGVAFPLQGDFAQKASSAQPTPMEQATARLFAGQRLANLRVQAGRDPGADPQVLAQQIAVDQTMTDGAIMAEIETLSMIVANRGQQQQPQRVASAQQRRTVPSMIASTNGMPPIQANLDPATGGLAQPTDDEFLFE